MEKKARLLKYAKATLRRLRFEQFIFTGQTGLFIAALLAVLVIAASRLFVLPYYGVFALGAAGFTVVVTVAYLIYKRYRLIEAIRRLDGYMPDNLLITAMEIDEKETHLAPALVHAADSEVTHAFEGFKKRRKTYLNVKMLAGLVGLSATLILLLLFPSESQVEANAIVKEQEIIKEMKQDVQDLMAKETLPDVKKELQELAKKLQQAETSEKILQELVKKQKEMRLQEKHLADKKERSAQSEDSPESWNATEEQELNTFGKVAGELAKNAGKAYTALNKIGKTPPLPALADTGTASRAEGGSMGEEVGESRSDADGLEDDENAGNIRENGQGRGGSPGQGEGQSQGQGEKQGEGQGQGQGQGQGRGLGPGESLGSGHSQGQGSGGRNLLSIPHKRVGEKGDLSVVGGNLGEGEFIEERETEGPVEKGAIRPYKEVVGNYKDAYMKSSEKMKLPPDLQHILSDYFSSIE